MTDHKPLSAEELDEMEFADIIADEQVLRGHWKRLIAQARRYLELQTENEKLNVGVNALAYERDRNAAERDKAQNERDRLMKLIEVAKETTDGQINFTAVVEMRQEIARLREALRTIGQEGQAGGLADPAAYARAALSGLEDEK